MPAEFGPPSVLRISKKSRFRSRASGKHSPRPMTVGGRGGNHENVRQPGRNPRG